MFTCWRIPSGKPRKGIVKGPTLGVSPEIVTFAETIPGLVTLVVSIVMVPPSMQPGQANEPVDSNVAETSNTVSA
jgi:hypothetical protein